MPSKKAAKAAFAKKVKKKTKKAKKKARRKPGQRYLEVKKVGDTCDYGVAFQIVKQSHREDFHPEGEEEEFVASNGIRLLASSHPQWDSDEDKLYVWGDDESMDSVLCVTEDTQDWERIQDAVEQYNNWVINTHWSTVFRNFSICSSGRTAMQRHKKAIDWFMAGLSNHNCCEWLRDSFDQDYDGFGAALLKAFTMKSGPLLSDKKTAKRAAKKAAKKKKVAKKKAKRRR
jgi:hypothetical protein